MCTESHDLRRILLCPQYEVKAPMPSACFRNICKQMAKMHEAIYELLPEEQTQVRSLFVFSTQCLWQLVDQRLESCVSIYRCCFWGSMPVSKCIWRGSWLGLELLMMEDRSMGKCAALPWKPANDWSMLIWQSSTSCFALKRSSTSFPVGVPRCFTFYWKRILNITWILDMSFICYIKVLELYLTNLTQI